MQWTDSDYDRLYSPTVRHAPKRVLEKIGGTLMRQNLSGAGSVNSIETDGWLDWIRASLRRLRQCKRTTKPAG